MINNEKIKAGEHVAIFGLTGCGKSTLTAQISTLYPRRVIFDRKREWSAARAGTRSAHDFESFARAYGETYELDNFEILVRPARGTGKQQLEIMAEEIFKLIALVEEGTNMGIGVILEEAWLYIPATAQPDGWLAESILTGRSDKFAIIANAQRPALVAKFFVSQCRHVFIGQFFEARDREYYRQTLGNLEIPDGLPKQFQFYWFMPGQQLELICV